MSEITLDPLLVAAISGTVVPILTGVVTKYRSTSGVKAVVAFVLSIVAGVLSTITTAASFTWRDVVAAVFVAFGANVTSYLGVWKPVGKSDAVPGQMLWPEFGVGRPVEQERL